MSDSLRPHGPWPARLLCPWDSPGKNTGVGCHLRAKHYWLWFSRLAKIFSWHCLLLVHLFMVWKCSWTDKLPEGAEGWWGEDGTEIKKKKKMNEEKLETEKILSTLIFSENCHKKKNSITQYQSELGSGSRNASVQWEPSLRTTTLSLR